MHIESVAVRRRAASGLSTAAAPRPRWTRVALAALALLAVAGCSLPGSDPSGADQIGTEVRHYHDAALDTAVATDTADASDAPDGALDATVVQDAAGDASGDSASDAAAVDGGLVIPQDFFGMHWTQHNPSASPILAPVVIGALGKPVASFWQYAEPSRGTYNWYPIDTALAFARAHGISMFYGHQFVPRWATSDTSTCTPAYVTGVYNCTAAPADERDWTDFLTTLVQRYKSVGVQTGCPTTDPQCHGVIAMYEGWNEPPWPNPMPIASFVRLETDFLNTIRANDPNARVCSPAFIIDPAFPSDATFMDSFFANGGPRTYDCYDFHIDAPQPEDQIARVNQFKTILARYGLADRTIYATESGRWLGGCGSGSNPPDVDQQAYIGRIELLYWSLGVRRHYWYAYDTCGTISNQPASATLTPAGIAYGNVERWMVGATMSTPCAASGTTWTCGLTRAGGYQAIAVWSTSGTASWTPPSWALHYRDLNGGTAAVAGALSIGARPILVENR